MNIRINRWYPLSRGFTSAWYSVGGAVPNYRDPERLDSMRKSEIAYVTADYRLIND